MIWVYTIVRTFPFWAIPLGFTFLMAGFSSKANSRAVKWWARAYIFCGFILLGLSGVYLINQGHKSAVLCHLANVSYRLGRTLEFDPATETCPGDRQANALFTREYREPFVVRDIT